MNEITMNTALSASNTLAANGRNPGIEDKTRVRESKTEKTSTTIRPPEPEKMEEKATAQPTAEELQKMAADLQRKVSGVDSQLQFSVDQETGSSVIKVMDKQTKEVIRQIPSEEMLRISRGLDRYKEGLLISSQA